MRHNVLFLTHVARYGGEDDAMALVGRRREVQELKRLAGTGRPELLVVYGRYRVGKTHLIREYHRDAFAFDASGIASGGKAEQLRRFQLSLKRAGAPVDKVPNDWFCAFDTLRVFLESGRARRDPESRRLVVFIDELPWLDTPKSGIVPAFDYFWNTWGSARNDLLLIVCGSATSWITRKLFHRRGGFHNRMTARVHLEPFTLQECEQLMQLNGFSITRQLVAEAYMTFGGIPFYLRLLDPRLGLDRAIDRMCFESDGPLRNEFDELYHSLFRGGEHHIAVVRALTKRRCGLTRTEISKTSSIPSGSTLTKTLEELELCGFVRRYRDFTRQSRDPLYQLIDHLTLFWLRFCEGERDEHYCQHNLGVRTRAHMAWPRLRDALPAT